MLAAAEQWGWFGPNPIDSFFGFVFEQLDNNIIMGLGFWPIQEALGIFLYIDKEEHFTPMNEWQAYFFLITVYPYLWFYSQFFVWTHISIIPALIAWLLIDPNILIKGQREDGTNIPRENFALTFAEVDCITAMLYGDLKWLYKGKDAV